MADAGTSVEREHALVTLPDRPRPAALYRIPVSLTLFGVFLIAVQAGRPVFGFLVMLTALLSTAGIAWRSLSKRYAPALVLRDQGDAKLLRGRYAEARALYERSLAIVQRELPPAAPEVLLNYYSLAAVNSMLHEHARADQYLFKLLDGLNHRVPAPWAGHVAWLLRRVAHHHSLEGRHDQAIALCNRALELVGDAPGADDNTVRTIIDDLAWIHHHAGSYGKAEALFRDALSIHEQYRDVVLELAQRGLREATRAASPYRAPGPGAASTSGGLDRAVAYSLLGLGWTVYERGSYGEARDLFVRAGIVAQSGAPSSRGSGTGDPLIVEILRGRAAVEMATGYYGRAEELYAEAKSRLGADDALVQSAALAIDLGWLARCRERFDEAEAAYAKVETLLDRREDGMSTIACALRESLAELRRRQGRHREAHREVQRATELAETCLGSEHPRRAAILAIASRIHTARCEFTDAERAARKCLQVLRSSLGREHPRLADGYVALGELQLARGQLGAAEQAFSRALELREATLGPEHPELVEVLEGHAAVYRALSREDEAGRAQARAESIRGRILR